MSVMTYKKIWGGRTKNSLLFSILAGILIGLGGLINLRTGGIIGAFLFSIGLLGILSQGLKLFTGMAGDTIRKELWIVLLGNVFGTMITAIATSLTFPDLTAPDLVGRFELFPTFFKAVLCGILMTVAVRGWRKGVLWLPIPCVMAFILAGFSHCIADSYYYFLMRDPAYILPWLISVVGNLVGCNIPYKRWIQEQ